MTLHTDPDKVRDWQRRSRPLGRTVPLGRTPLATVTPLRSAGFTAPVVPLRPGRRPETGAEIRKFPATTHSRDTIPPRVRKLVRERDEDMCVHCGKPAQHIHHRRLKGDGGDPRPHTNCPCNLVCLCFEHHEWAHNNRAEAEAEGLIISREELWPWLHSVLVHGYEDAGGTEAWPLCNGRYQDFPPVWRCRMSPSDAIVITILGGVFSLIAAYEVMAWRQIRRYRREEQQRLAAWRQRPRGGPLDGAGLITDEDEEILAGIQEATDRRPGQ